MVELKDWRKADKLVVLMVVKKVDSMVE